MKQQLSVLIVEDHPMAAKAYEKCFDLAVSSNDKIDFKIEIAHNCDEAIQKINSASSADGLDIVFLDIGLPPSSDGVIKSGEDLGIWIRKILPESKKMICTTFNTPIRISSILKSIDPDAFLIKDEIEQEDVILAVNNVLFLTPHYSPTVLRAIRKSISFDNLVDNIDRQILYELSIGSKMKDLPDIIPLSIAGIEKRKRILKETFNLLDKDDRALILLAKDKGFI
jgi:DNA-binding NarL/FixJ family response regulator